MMRMVYSQIWCQKQLKNYWLHSLMSRCQLESEGIYKTNMHSVVKRLMLARGLRSIGQGAMVVDITLYLKALHWNGTLIGDVTSAAGLFGAALILLVGVLSDKMGRKPFLIIYEVLTVFSAVAVCITTRAVLLIFAIVIVGFGRGQNGAAGPFTPAEQAWLARYVDNSQRGKVFSLNSAVGFLGMALGSAIGGIPGFMHTTQPMLAYRPVFIMVAIISIICISILLRTEETNSSLSISTSDSIKLEKKNETVSLNQKNRIATVCLEVNNNNVKETTICRQENMAMFKLALVNTINGIAVGLTGPKFIDSIVTLYYSAQLIPY